MATRKKKVLLFSVPFNGHLNVLKNVISEFSDDVEFKLVITGWKNIPADLTGVASSIVLAKSQLRETDPALWTFPRVVELLDDCEAIAAAWQPDLIIYDFFSLEGLFTAKRLRIPAWCSIPAMIGPFDHKSYLAKKLSVQENQQALQILKRKGIEIKEREIEMISDGVHIAGDLNLVWSYRALTDRAFMRNRKRAKYVFIGNLTAKRTIEHSKKNEKSKKNDKSKKHKKSENRNRDRTASVFVSLGTVVMNNLWNQQRETRAGLKKFIFSLAKRWGEKKRNKMNVIFVTQGKRVLPKYPRNWQVYNTVDQVKTLAKTDVFVTHGGSNSFHEAVSRHVPMVVIPFFGDQPLVARRAELLGIGVNLGMDENIDTKKKKGFLNDRLASRVDSAVEKILNTKSYTQKYTRLKLECTDIRTILLNAQYRNLK